MEFKNVENFEKWVQENARVYYGNISDWLDEVEKKYSENAMTEYELSSWESKDGLPHLYSYSVIEEEVDDDIFDITFIF